MFDQIEKEPGANRRSFVCKGFVLAGCLFGLGNSVLMAWTFYAAFFNGYHVLVTVNDFGEAWYEFILIPVVLVFIFSGAVCSVLLFRKSDVVLAESHGLINDSLKRHVKEG
jgi:hypothetical protein